MNTTGHHNAIKIEPHKTFTTGGFKVMPFDVRHDVPTVGFIINHLETGNVLFITDTFYCPYRFKDLNNIIIEANFSREIIDRKVKEGTLPEFLRNRILKSHLSLEYCIELLKSNDLTSVNQIILTHLSNSNSYERQFKQEVSKATGKNVTVASNGLKIPFSKTPF